MNVPKLWYQTLLQLALVERKRCVHVYYVCKYLTVIWSLLKSIINKQQPHLKDASRPRNRKESLGRVYPQWRLVLTDEKEVLQYCQHCQGGKYYLTLLMNVIVSPSVSSVGILTILDLSSCVRNWNAKKISRDLSQPYWTLTRSASSESGAESDIRLTSKLGLLDTWMSK